MNLISDTILGFLFKIGLIGKRLSGNELVELQEINRLVSGEKWKLAHIQGNTMLIPDGQNVLKAKEAEVKLYENVRDAVVSQKLESLGFPKGTPVQINLKNGKIIV